MARRRKIMRHDRQFICWLLREHRRRRDGHWHHPDPDPEPPVNSGLPYASDIYLSNPNIVVGDS